MLFLNSLNLTVTIWLTVVISGQAVEPARDGWKREIHLYGLNYKDADVQALARTHSNLQVLRIGWPGMTDSAMAEVAKLTKLEELEIQNITHSSIQETKQVIITAAGWKAIAALRKLESLRVDDIKIDEGSMKEIGKLHQIKTLYLAHNGVTDAGVKHLAGMKQITSLGLLQLHITDQSIPVLLKLQNLETLLVDQTGLTDEAMKQLAKLPKLKSIDVRATKITATGVRELVSSKTLQKLVVHKRQMPADLWETLIKSNPGLSIVITDARGFSYRSGQQPDGNRNTPAKGEKDKSWKPLFDGKTLTGWKSANFGGEGEVSVKNGAIVMEMGNDMTGVTYTKGDFPKLNYEIMLEGKKVKGKDFFCTTTFPVGDKHCSFVVGGWGGTIVGLSTIDFFDASENETTKFMDFKQDQWYKVRIRVTKDRIETWIDDKQVVDVATRDKNISIRAECNLCKPFGIATWRTTGAARDIKVRPLTAAEIKAASEKK